MAGFSAAAYGKAKASLLTSLRVAKLLRAASAAAIANPFLSTPYKSAPAWTTGTAYKFGNVVANAGNWYVAANSGTSGASAPVHTNSSAVTDGGVLWTYYGPARSTADDPATPAVVVNTTIPSGFSNVYRINPVSIGTSGYLPGSVRLIGGTAADNAGSLKIETFFQSAGAATKVYTRVGLEFETDVPLVAFGLSPFGAPVQLTIDGRLYAPDGIVTGASGTQIVQVTFPGAGRLTHRLRVNFTGNQGNGFGQIFLPPGGQIWASSNDMIRAAFLSDSIFAGSGFGPFLVGQSAPERIATMLGWTDPWDFSIGGTGYINAGTFTAFGWRIPQILAANPDVLVMFGSTNDNGQPSADITAAVLAVLRAFRAGSAAPIILFGVWPNSAASLTTETAVKAAYTAFADPLTFFVPIAGDTASGLPWLTGAWNNAANTASLTASLFLGGDGTHPVDAGTEYLARRMVQAIRSQVLPKLALKLI